MIISQDNRRTREDTNSKTRKKTKNQIKMVQRCTRVPSEVVFLHIMEMLFNYSSLKEHIKFRKKLGLAGWLELHLHSICINILDFVFYQTLTLTP